MAQPSLQKMKQQLSAEKQNPWQSFYKFELNGKMPTQAGLLFSPDMVVTKATLRALQTKGMPSPGTAAYVYKLDVICKDGQQFSCMGTIMVVK